MKGNKKIAEYGKNTTFDKRPENIHRGGRPKKIYTVLKEKGYSKDDIVTAFGELAWYSLQELKTISEDEKKPAITRIVANQFITALKKSDWTKIKEILEHVIGKPTQQINQKTETADPISIIVSDKSKKAIDKLKDADN